MTAPTMDERRAVALRMRGYDCPVLPSHQTTREAVDAVVECMGLEEGEEVCTVRQFLDRLAELIDPGERTDEDGRDALDWVREHGGLEAVKKLLDWVVGHCSTKQQLDFDFWLSGRVMHELGFDEDMADRDEVERRLLARLMPDGMSWPVFEDGEPVRIGDDFVDMHGRAHTVASVRLKECGEFSLVGTDRWGQGFPAGSRVGRPGAAPKVLDADGVEIRVGDVLYRKSDGHMVKVAEVYENTFTDADDYVRPGDGFTHRAPVFAADVRPLREGEHVYHVETGAELVVKELPKPGEYQAVVVFDTPASHLTSFDPDQLTHERPVADTWERMEEDAGKEACEYFAHMPCGCETSEVLDETVEKCNAAKARDLVCRARALAERGE